MQADNQQFFENERVKVFRFCFGMKCNAKPHLADKKTDTVNKQILHRQVQSKLYVKTDFASQTVSKVFRGVLVLLKI